MIIAVCLLFTACDLLNQNDIEEFTVTFDSNGGSAVESQKVAKGEKIRKPEDPTKVGYTFDGWYVDDEKWSFVGHYVTEDMTLTAKWVEKTRYEVRFVDEDGNLLHKSYVLPGSTVSKPATPEKTGCAFVGWFDGGIAWDFENGKVNKDLTLTTRWVAQVLYQLNGGTNSDNNPSKIYSNDEFPIVLENATKSGYTFMGWYSDSSFTNRVDTITLCQSQVLYALWIQNPSDNPGGGNNPGGSDSTDSLYPWNTTTIKIQLTDNSNRMELPSCARRYLAGDLSKTTDRSTTIDDYIKQRNDAALEATNVKVVYEYLADTDAYSWGNNIDTIDSEIRSKDPSRPDMYCNFIYDLVAVSLKGSFANLYSSTMYKDGHELAGIEHNYFEFAQDPGYFDSGNGYMYEYMRSLTLSKYKMYCLASDYTIDVVRAFLVIPVNISLLETLYTDNSTDFLKDRVETFDEDINVKTNYTIEDFYALVNDMEWTYETLAKFADKITVDNSGESGIDLRDTVGFALGTSSGLPASGMLYTTSIPIINRYYDVDKGDYTYSYPGTVNVGGSSFAMYEDGTPDDLIEFCQNLTSLMNTWGVITVSNSDARSTGYGDTDLAAIRQRFADGNVLFGGIVTLGSLEYDEYKDMNKDGKKGYGIVPVPLYRSDSYDQYLTHISNVGKIMAISYTTEKFSQCTAYLNYQSTHSTEILNEYYDYKLAYDVGTGVTGNVEMLRYIRYNVRSSFDSVFEDVLAQFYSATDANAISEKWHQMLKAADFKLENIEHQYSIIAPKKATFLYDLENYVYPYLPE